MKRIAMIMPGGVAQQKDGVQIPILFQFVERLSNHYDITIHSLVTLDPFASTSSCGNAKVKILPASYRAHWTRKLFQYMMSVYQDHRNKRYDLLHGMYGVNAGVATLLLGKILAVPTVFSVFGGETVALPAIDYGALRRPVTKSLTKLVCNGVTGLTVLTEYQTRQLNTLGVNRSDISVIPYGVDTQIFFPNRKAARLNPPFHFLHVANLLEVKDQITLLRAFAEISRKVECSLRIIGTDYLDGKIQRFARELGIAERVEFFTWIDHRELTQHYRWAHFLLHTSLHEAQAMVVAEAAACGTVVCGTNVGLIHDLGPERVVAVAPQDYQGLAQQTLGIINNPERYFALQRNALEWTKTFTLDWTVQQYRALYENAIAP